MRNMFYLLTYPTAELRYKVHDQKLNVFAACPQRRQKNWKYVDSVIQITAELVP